MAKAVDKAYQLIRDGIMTGRYKQGAHITAQELAEDSGLSRTPVREAMRRLHSEGVIQIIPNRGAFVASWGEEDIGQYFELATVLESFAAELAASRITDKELVELSQLVDEMNRLVELSPPRMDEIHQVNDQFHKKIMAASGNSRLEHYLQSMIEAQLVLGTLREYSPEELKRSALQHGELVAALEARDATWARSVMTTHLLSARHAFMRTLGPHLG
ncbi:MAG: GntR family transcriptional regulator [Pseudomonadales bacterium]